MSMNPAWPTWFYVGQVKDHNKVVDAFMPYILKEKEYFHEPWTLASCLSSCQHDKNGEMPWNVWADAIKPNFEEFLNGMQPFTNYSIDIIESWVNIYKKGGYQEIHDHMFPGRCFSCSYFFEKPEGEDARGELVFENMDYSRISATGLDRVFQQMKTKLFIPEVKTGDIVFFPSWVKHFTHPNNSNQRRTTFSANFAVTEATSVENQPFDPKLHEHINLK